MHIASFASSRAVMAVNNPSRVFQASEEPELARLSESDAPMSDEDFSHAGNEIFAMYDDEEAQIGDSKER